MSILRRVTSPAELKGLSDEELGELADEIRRFLIEKVSRTGGHMGPNLGVVELTVALHAVFDSPKDPIVFDTSHQAYVHKILTGRAGGFDRLRSKGGLSGYTNRSESEHDWTESSHASAALSYADGLSRGFAIRGEAEHTVVAVVGDGALTGGMCWEALNNIAEDERRNVVIVVNDNGRSYSPTIGGFAENLYRLRMLNTYDRVMEQGKSTLKSLGRVGQRTFEALHAFKEGVKSSVIPAEMFPELGMKNIGPVPGHDLGALIDAFRYARDYRGPIIVHTVTEKGRGYPPASTESDDFMHSSGPIDAATGRPIARSSRGFTDVFSAELVELGERRDDVVAITAAMAGPTGLEPFKARFPDRFVDVGIAEQHALTSAAGLALSGLHPVVALYATFLNRGFDQLAMDVGLLSQPVTIVLDRAGVTGTDGASHNGLWDMVIGSLVPGVRIAAPRDGRRLSELFREAVAAEDGPTIVRYPKGSLPEEIPAIDAAPDGVETIFDSSSEAPNGAPRVLLVSVGALAGEALGAAEALSAEGAAVTVVDPRWVAPVAESLGGLAAASDLVLTVEDGMARGGIGSQLSEWLAGRDIDVPVRHCAFPALFPEHMSRAELLAEVGLDAAGIAEAARRFLRPRFAAVSGARARR